MPHSNVRHFCFTGQKAKGKRQKETPLILRKIINLVLEFLPSNLSPLPFTSLEIPAQHEIIPAR
jgi:hypothetical protein